MIDKFVEFWNNLLNFSFSIAKNFHTFLIWGQYQLYKNMLNRFES